MALNRNQALLTAFVNRLQELENAAWGLLSALSISGAVAAGASDLLTKLGAIVGELRLGRTDADYAAGIRLKVRVNASAGRTVDVVAVAMLAYAPLLPNYLEPGTTPGFLIDMPGLASGPYVADKIKHARPAGVPGVVSWTTGGFVLTLDSVTASAVASPGLLDSVSSPGMSVPTAGLMSIGYAV